MSNNEDNNVIGQILAGVGALLLVGAATAMASEQAAQDVERKKRLDPNEVGRLKRIVAGCTWDSDRSNLIDNHPGQLTAQDVAILAKAYTFESSMLQMIHKNRHRIVDLYNLEVCLLDAGIHRWTARKAVV